MARHCTEIHGMHTMYLEENRKPKCKPHRPDWQEQVLNPRGIWVTVRDDSDESDSSSFVGSQDIIDIEKEGLDTLEQTMEMETKQEEPVEQISDP